MREQRRSVVTEKRRRAGRKDERDFVSELWVSTLEVEAEPGVWTVVRDVALDAGTEAAIAEVSGFQKALRRPETDVKAEVVL